MQYAVCKGLAAISNAISVMMRLCTEPLKAGQKPTTLVIGCCDSRVHPPALLGTSRARCLVVRNVARSFHRLTEQRSASVAAGFRICVQVLQVKRVIVLGHKGCGGIRTDG